MWTHISHLRSAPPKRHSNSFPTSNLFCQLPDRKLQSVTPPLHWQFWNLRDLPSNYTTATLSPSPQPDPKTHPAPDLRSRNRTEPPSPPWHLSSESLDPSMLTWSQSHPDSQTQARQSPPHLTSPARAARAQTKLWHADACPEPSQQVPQTPQATSMSK